MTDPAIGVSPSPSTSPGGRATGDATPRRVARASWVGLVVLLDHVGAALTFVAAGGYLVLKVFNDRQSTLMRVVDEVARWFYELGIHESPGLPDYPALRNFADPYFAEAYMIAMAALHLLAMAGFLALADGLSGFRPWARRAHIAIASLVLLMLGGYACACWSSTSPWIGLAVMAADAIIPIVVLAILLTPGVASLFTEGPRPTGPPPSRPRGRESYQPRLALGLVLAVFVLVSLATVFIASGPIAINLKVALAPAE